jgi:hypothetical protein
MSCHMFDVELFLYFQHLRRKENRHCSTFLWPQGLHHKEYDTPVTVQSKVRLIQIIVVIVIIIIIIIIIAVCHIWYTNCGNTPDSNSECT